MLVATTEATIGAASVRWTLVFERAVRGTVVRRKSLSFDTRFAARAAGKPEPVGHLFLLLAGRFVPDRGESVTGPVAHLLADDEMERQTPSSRTFRTEGDQVDVVHLRFARPLVLAPIGMERGPIALPPACWDAISALIEGAPRGDSALLARVLDTLAGAGIIAPTITQTVIAQEPEPFRRLWEAMQPVYQTYGATMSLKQLADRLGMSMRQVGRDAKEMTAAFGLGGGYRDALLVLRLRMAMLLLSAPEATVADVAKLVGYGSPIAMARAFRDAKLPSPSAIQAALRDAPE